MYPYGSFNFEKAKLNVRTRRCNPYRVFICFNIIVILFPKEKILTTFGNRSFSVAAPKLKNTLPTELRNMYMS